MESDLLMKEDEYYKENQKLEEKTKQLMKKVNDVMKIQDNLIKDSLQTKVEISNVRKNTYKFTKKPTDDELLFDESEENYNSEAGSQAFNNGLCKVYKTKLKNVVAEKERVLMDLKQKNEEIKKLQKENQRLRSEKEKWFLAYSAGKNNIGKLETQISGLNAKVYTKDGENLCLKKEIEQLKKDLKTTQANLNNHDVRLTRSVEEAEKLRIAVKNLKEEDKETKELHRKQVNELTQTIKQLEKQKFEVVNGFEKQMELIDNLKKQNVEDEGISAKGFSSDHINFNDPVSRASKALKVGRGSLYDMKKREIRTDKDYVVNMSQKSRGRKRRSPII